MSWIKKTETNIETEQIQHIHSEVREERRFWFDRSIAYMNFYSTIVSALLSAFVLGLTQLEDLGQYKYMLVTLPLISLVLCIYAKRIIRICYRQFLENTATMVKVETLMGLYNPIEADLPDGIPFSQDRFLNPERYYDNFMKFDCSNDFVEHDLRQTNRTYSNTKRVFTLLQILSALMIGGFGGIMILQ